MASVPTGLTPAVLGPRVPYHDPSVPVVLLWSEKSGCTSLLTWFLHQIGRLDEARAHSDWLHDWELDVLKATPGYEGSIVDALHAGVPAVKLVRDPFDRAVSSFFMMSVLGDDSGHFTVGLRRSLRDWLYGDPDVPFGFGFVDFLRWMTTVDPAHLNPHLGPQFTTLEDHLPGLALMRLDRFDDEIRRLETRLGLPAADLGSVSSSSHHTVRASSWSTDAGALGRVQFPIPTPRDWHLPPSDAFVTDETAHLVHDLFREDYDRYGFTPRRPPAPNSAVWASPGDAQTAEIEELRRYAHDLRTALDAWETSRTARALDALRRVRSAVPRPRRSPPST